MPVEDLPQRPTTSTGRQSRRRRPELIRNSRWSARHPRFSSRASKPWGWRADEIIACLRQGPRSAGGLVPHRLVRQGSDAADRNRHRHCSTEKNRRLGPKLSSRVRRPTRKARRCARADGGHLGQYPGVPASAPRDGGAADKRIGDRKRCSPPRQPSPSPSCVSS